MKKQINILIIEKKSVIINIFYKKNERELS